MSVMNDLLGKIVTASGGEVTSAGNRNGLLQDWLNTVGEVCVPLWQPNGVNQYVQLPLITLNDGDSVSFRAFSSSVQNNKFIGSASDTGLVGIDSNRDVVFRFDGSWRVVGAVPVIEVEHHVTCRVNSGQMQITVDGVQMSDSPCSGFSFDIAGAGRGQYHLGGFRGLVVNDGSAFNYPLDDGFENNPTARNIGSGADGTFINNDAAAWGERCE